MKAAKCRQAENGKKRGEEKKGTEEKQNGEGNGKAEGSKAFRARPQVPSAERGSSALARAPITPSSCGIFWI